MFDVEYLDIPPLARAGGTVRLPGSKSISNRVLLLAALSHGQTTVHALLASDDTAVMLTALRQLGCTVQQQGDTAVIGGLGGQLLHGKAALFMGNAGTAIRPLTAALALLGGEFELSGVPRMHERPIGDLVDALRQLGCSIDYLGHEGFPPLRLHPRLGPLTLDKPIRVRGDVSSQFLTALLMALPLVASRDIHIEVVGELISRPYIEITLKLLQRFGIQVQREDWQRFTIPAGSQYQSPGEIHVEGDASSASYFIALGAIAESARGQNGIEILGVGADSIQGDIRFVEAARMMGAEIDSTANALRITRGQPGKGWPLKAIDLDCNHIPDAAMTLAVMALYADGTTVLRNIASWRVKETDRIAAMACELRKLGATVEEGPDYLKITPPASLKDWKTAAIHTYDDHRMAMCFSLAAFNPAQRPIRILDPKCVAKTFPDYFETLFSVAETDTARIPVICIDGPTASGKGTLAALTAQRLGYHYLDSGALYRLSAFAAERAGVALDDAEGVARIAHALPVRFQGDRIFLDAEDVSDAIRTEAAGMAASRVSVHPQVRAALVRLQHSFRQLPGLVADGRDMGSVIFPDAPLKIYLTASALRRAERRHKQLIPKGNPATMHVILQDLKARDARDMSRQAAPLKPADQARLLDNSDLSIEKSVSQVIDWWQGTRPF
ncbi:MAG: bifunctional 3-phosphoshikimate 1-carboxyvinyltransferase/cytidylate kinase [Polaromonas sp.]|uniref:bifunctional 3-phosphoshikimate 1-carboxyvinyltransferase/cytidylate kinase n=1 Tax=Polaromonas sp. TaxID=1869339 RepID=UPI00272F32A0|nr:bifunctional 3-phosphoshikimate 1-carboxyvinyltransferase/cytidylate kinase [Polaromonas sp.]MDP2256963.1 bifunctional 3-phosphoshikimate 1-carboxyvinyltransferase/cytidylate kinase [Polaromonas sp.]